MRKRIMWAGLGALVVLSGLLVLVYVVDAALMVTTLGLLVELAAAAFLLMALVDTVRWVAYRWPRESRARSVR